MVASRLPKKQRKKRLWEKKFPCMLSGNMEMANIIDKQEGHKTEGPFPGAKLQKLT